MGIEILHQKEALAPDGPNDAEVQPSDWNAPHTVNITGPLKAVDAVSPSGTGKELITVTGAESAALILISAFVESLMALANAAEVRDALGIEIEGFATTDYVQAQIAGLINAAPGALDTLDELAAALGDDANFAATMTAALAGKVATSRAVNTSGLASGGGNLSADRTIDVPVASQAEAEAGTNNAKAMTPLRVAQAIAALSVGGGGGAPLDSPNFTGSPTAPTPTAGNNSTLIATTAFVQAAIAALVNAAPGALDTLDELAAALGDDANFAATMTAALAGKVATSRTVNTSGLASGGGNLSADRTIDVPVASQAEAEAGADNAKAMTPLRVAQAIAALAGGGGGQPVPSTTDFAVGTLLLAVRTGGSGTVASGSTTSGSNLRTVVFGNLADASGASMDNGATLSGTWKNLSGRALSVQAASTPMTAGYWVRTA